MASNLYSTLAILLLSISISRSARIQAIGVNWGTTSSHPLPPPKVVELLKSNNITKVKLFDADPLVLQSLSGSRIEVTVGIPNSMLRGLNSSEKAAESWVHDNLTRYLSDSAGGVRIHQEFPHEHIMGDGQGSRWIKELYSSGWSKVPSDVQQAVSRSGMSVQKLSLYTPTGQKAKYIAVGDEPFLRSYGEQFYPFVVGAASNIQTAVIKANLENKVKVVVPCSYDAFQSDSGLPSKGHFRSDVNKTMIELLMFLNKHRSPFFVTISPFLSHYQNKNISLDFALMKETARSHNDSHKIYKNNFDLIYDTLVTALLTGGSPQIDIVISQIGWPTDGAANATSSTAEVFMKNLMDHLHTKTGTPLRPKDPPIETYIFSLLDEDQRSIAIGSFERHWGVFTFDGQAKYHVDFGQGSRKLVNAQGVDYFSSKWCVVNNNIDLSNATASALDACSVADCSALSPGGSCFNINWPGNISYAFNSYYQQHDQKADSCDFGGLGLITTVDPSVQNCRFPVELMSSHSVSFPRSYLVQPMVPLAVTILLFLSIVRW
ncbi:hypothetical protein RJ639_015119 [Escallonia herrerae]|uniref:X8 domain-containing protein n=1 Tax=Escallonia herrerae TaxID=1293975 RepID=A0AA88VJC1_9ASTE|nr:hypothetical protein RJ639_015119 [Escallonia herrerae]